MIDPAYPEINAKKLKIRKIKKEKKCMINVKCASNVLVCAYHGEKSV